MSAAASPPWHLWCQVVFALISIQVSDALVTRKAARQPQVKGASQAIKDAIGLDVGSRVQCRNAPFGGGSIDNVPWLDGNIASIQETRNALTNSTEPYVKVLIDQHSKPIHCEQVRALDYYLFEWVGFEDTDGADMPGSPHGPHAKCLTVGGTDRLGGRSLLWEKCMDKAVSPNLPPNAKTRVEAQMFKLNDDGSVTHKNSSLCVRRMKCKEGSLVRGFVYDLGQCRSDMNLRISVKKPQANMLEHMREMGFLAHAVRREDCQLCGVYQLKNMCLGSANCGASWQAKPGWTKLASQYIGLDAIMGRSKYGTEVGGEAERSEMMGTADFGDMEFSGFGESPIREGQCGTFTTDRPLKFSFFYLLKAEPEKKVI